MNLTTSVNNQIFGSAQCPGDKSISQRVLMVGALMNQEMKVDGFLHGEDPLSTMNALNQIGAGITVDESGLIYLHKRKQIFDNCEHRIPTEGSSLGLQFIKKYFN